MSLSRILNDDPVPPLPVRTPLNAPPKPPPLEIPQSALSSQSIQPHSRSHSGHSRAELFNDLPGPPQHGYSYRPPPPEIDRWEGLSDRRWPDPVHPVQSGSSHPISERAHSISPIWMPRSRWHTGPTNDPEVSLAPRKRRKGGEADAEHRSSMQKRIPPPKPPIIVPKDLHPDSLIHHDSPVRHFFPDEHESRPMKHATEAERLASSDLEDCEEIWIGELSEYMIETQKRLKQVEQWFNDSTKERTSVTAQKLSHYYASKVASIPEAQLSPSPPPAPAIPSSNDNMPMPSMPTPMLPPQSYDDPVLSNNFDLQQPEPPNVEDVRSPPDSTMGDVTIPPHAGRRPSKARRNKRTAPENVSDVGSEPEVAMKTTAKGRASKKRKIEKPLLPVDLPENISANYPIPTPSKGKGKARDVPIVEDVMLPPESEPAGSPGPSKAPRKRPGPKKKQILPQLPPPPLSPHLALPEPVLALPPAFEMDPLVPPVLSLPPSGDVTPMSRPASPAPTVTSVVFELDEDIPPLRRAKKMDENGMVKRVKALEEAQRKVWHNIARREAAKVYKYHATGYQARQAQAERISKLASMQARRPFSKTPKTIKDTQTKAKRLMREMQMFWKKNEKEERDVRKREQKEALDRLKLEEEKREAARQARKLEFLISQTELYSHFVGNKLKTSELEGDGEETGEVPAGADVDDVDQESLTDINFDDEDKTNLYRHARRNAEEAITMARERALEFDNQAALERKTKEALKLAKSQGQTPVMGDDEFEDSGESASEKPKLVDLDSDELNFQNPTSLSGPLTIRQPEMLMAQLKEYQLKGLNWLATLYDQGINGILADEMGLGKTIQSISLLAYLAETHDIWGPFLVVAPSSTLHNWQQELTRFVPKLKALPYWGSVKDRATLRKFWRKKDISYDEDAPFHVLITSYQLIIQDQQYLQRVKWQYMILDEAQNIKNSSSARWKTLLGLHCRNRLLLTGTPIQNSMQELWALLHFIMPSLFDSHDEFNEWFSKDIENAAENKGSKLNEHQLRRLHMILKPFMLRRVKRHVQNELSEKIEEDIYVDLSARQRALYKTLVSRVSVADLLRKATTLGDADSARTLMNLVMQFRKVCNHPELFERADVVAPFSFSHFARSGPLSREGDFIPLPYSTRNPIEVHIPELLYHDGGLVNVPTEKSISSTNYLTKLMNIWSTDWIHQSLHENQSSSFSFLLFLGMSAQEMHSLHCAPLIRAQLQVTSQKAALFENGKYLLDKYFIANARADSSFSVPSRTLLSLDRAENLPDLYSIALESFQRSCLSRADMKWYIPSAVAPPISLCCIDKSFMESQSRLQDAPLETLALYGVPPALRDSDTACAQYESLLSGTPPIGLFDASPSYQIPASKMQVPDVKRLIYDSAKLAALDALLQELKTGDHRVLVYSQMTRMLDLMEEYLIYRQYKYLRLDGSSKMEDRRDMVIDWQTRPDIFVFLLSTRAGGLGINLTAADTVIFYDHDWNPSNDAQAMDRAHRLGQTRQVTVYRLITKGTIDERIMQLARVKKDVQDIVVGNKTLHEITKPSDLVQLLLKDEQFANMDSAAISNGPVEGGASPDLWNSPEDADDFFGQSGPAQTSSTTPTGLEEELEVPDSARGKKRKSGAGSGTRGRKPGPKKRGVTDTLEA